MYGHVRWWGTGHSGTSFGCGTADDGAIPGEAGLRRGGPATVPWLQANGIRQGGRLSTVERCQAEAPREQSLQRHSFPIDEDHLHA